jgi:hypothetical protein
MELRQLRDFIAIAEEHGFHKAARRLPVAQPALSACVKQLEEEPGYTLLERSRHRVTITAAGRELLLGPLLPPGAVLRPLAVHAPRLWITLLLPGRDIAPAALALASVARELSAGSGSVPRSIPPERTDRPATHRRIRHS